VELVRKYGFKVQGARFKVKAKKRSAFDEKKLLTVSLTTTPAACLICPSGLVLITMILHTGNRLEKLAEKLAEGLMAPVDDPLKNEIIVVQSKGMERWVSMELARHTGLCANIRFPFPNAFVFEIFQQVIPEFREAPLFDPPVMAWRIMEVLPHCLREKEFEGLRRYLETDPSELKRFQLSQRLAGLFDQYLLFRPDLILSWDRGADTQWQALLWRRLAVGHEKSHRAFLQKTFLKVLESESNRPACLPQRLALFGISALPPFHLQVLAALSRVMEVNVFLMNPCREYWGDIFSRGERKRLSKSRKKGKTLPAEMHLETGNSLLASMGMLGRDFFDAIIDLGCQEEELFRDPGEDTLLHRIQSDILNLRDRGGEGSSRQEIEAGDASIQVHSCHSPMREVEVLQDALLGLFATNPTLLPKDILVMAPDIETYAPFIQAVFALPTTDRRFLPFTIADRGARRESRLIDAFLRLLDLPGSRLTAARVLALLETPAVQRKFALKEADLELLERWVRDTRIRWGGDGSSRKELGLPAFPENSWRAGLQRMLLGYALPAREDRLFMGILPYDRIEGEETLLLGNFLAFMECLFTAVRDLDQARTPEEWGVFLTLLLTDFFLAREEEGREAQLLRRTFRGLMEQQAISGFQEKVNLEIVRTSLCTSLEQEGFGSGFLSGGVTFGALLPMRSIPFRVIALLGMNDDAYPRQTRALGFDLIAKNPRPGDRSRRKDDRYLFLEALLSARDHFYLSYGGQSIQDNSLRPPSVLVSELLDYITQGYFINSREILEEIVTPHRLQAFSPAYFREKVRLQSFSRENFEAARRTVEPRREPRPFMQSGLPEPSEDWKTITLDQLHRFFAHPARFFLQQRLGVDLEEGAGILEDQEPLDLSGLDRYQLEQDLAEKVLHHRDLREEWTAVRASGQLPPGTPGQWLYDQTCLDLDLFSRAVLHRTARGALPPLEVDVPFQGFRLQGRLVQRYEDGLLHYRYARMRPQDRLKLWIELLLIHWLKVPDQPCQGLLICKDTCCRLDGVEESEKALKLLLHVYRQGLTRPLPFFPRASWAYAEALVKHGQREKAREAARKVWESDFGTSEGEDPYFQLCFGHGDPLDETFENLAQAILIPLAGRDETLSLQEL
jgi:exodeoxyribonuclease V gamma subunit